MHFESLAPKAYILDFGGLEILTIQSLTLCVKSHNIANVLQSLWYNEHWHCVQHTNLPTISYRYLGLKHILLYTWFWHAVYQYNSKAES